MAKMINEGENQNDLILFCRKQTNLFVELTKEQKINFQIERARGIGSLFLKLDFAFSFVKIQKLEQFFNFNSTGAGNKKMNFILFFFCCVNNIKIEK